MNCPYCGKEMTKGHLQGSRAQGIVWVPEDTKLRLFWESKLRLMDLGALFMADSFGLRSGFRLTCYLCKNCKKGIFDIEEEKPAILYCDTDKKES